MEIYLSKCLSSLIIPDEKLLKSLEVLVVNDGSKDNSSKIAHEFETKYPDTFRVIDKENGNYGSCINRGLKEATGKYIKVLDADDYFNTDNFTQYLHSLKEVDVDLIITDYDLVTETGAIKETRSFILPPRTPMLLQEHMRDIFNIQMHAITYRTRILKEERYVQQEGISHTDAEWVFYPMTRVTTIYYINDVVYEYLVGRTGQTVDLTVWANKASDRERIARREVEYFEKFKISNIKDSILPFLSYRILTELHGIYLTYLIIKRDEKHTRQLDDFLHQTSPVLFTQIEERRLHDKYMPIKYIKSWRKKGKLPSGILSYLYCKIKKI